MSSRTKSLVNSRRKAFQGSASHGVRRRHHQPRFRRLWVETLEDRRILTLLPYPVPLTGLEPRGSLLYSGTVGGVLTPTGDTDSYWLNLDAGQQFSVVLEPGATLQAAVTVSAPGNVPLGSGTAGAAGQVVYLNDLPAASAGTYTIAVTTAGGTTGNFTLRVLLNGTLEAENVGGPANDTQPTAQNLNSSFLGLNAGTAQRAAVLGTVGADLFAISRGDNVLRTIDATTGATLASVALTVAGGGVYSCEGIAVDPTTGMLFGLLNDSWAQELVTLNPLTGLVTRIGNIGVSGRRFGEIVFDPSGNLYGVTGGSGANPSSLFAIDQANPGSQTLRYTFSTQGSGGLALNPDNGLLYRYDDGLFQSLDASQNPVGVTTLPLPGGNIGSGTGMVYCGAGEFVVTNNSGGLYRLHSDGS